ncbi:metal-dependent hydrolase [Staphylococcus gallinarum]|uniref:Metal-dependent hydrolase n=1 Tax=Staphylococcus gallinarum TaxID=1293 RepID=A0A380FIG8_STAGA|nr:metal-dependent hydrolase [Staphylococcus gallinarum]
MKYKKINKTYRDKDKVTDVISFALEEDEPEITGLDMPRVLGDIIICTDVANEQAESYGPLIRKRTRLFSITWILTFIRI